MTSNFLGFGFHYLFTYGGQRSNVPDTNGADVATSQHKNYKKKTNAFDEWRLDFKQKKEICKGVSIYFQKMFCFHQGFFSVLSVQLFGNRK